ncbi:hypothetical protein MWU57_09650 [Isoptericola sp. S6320L]|uniref:hypothetical protein n=1 Tax=Isoptericola sp. S6320L TaxID=2926411 RepID=UPI001FF5D800|nr:hypothetical protein [Isoptericola sp. S6320L]MCK0117297.1 hypothetical protein [Isoptericola sp. S6320L]
MLRPPFLALDAVAADCYAEVGWSIERAASSFRRVPHRVLLVPSLDRRTALGELRHRSLADKGTDWISGGHDFLAEWYDDPGAREIATGVLVTAGQTPRKSAERVVALVGGGHP